MPITRGADRESTVSPGGPRAAIDGSDAGTRAAVWVSPGTLSLCNDRHGGHIMNDPTRVNVEGHESSETEKAGVCPEPAEGGVGSGRRRARGRFLR